MTKEINFDNITIKYNGDEISKANISKSHRLSIIGAICITLLIIGIPVILSNIIDITNNIWGIILIVLMDIGIFMLCLGILLKIYKNSLPRQIDYMEWLLELNSDDIEIGWFNNRYIVIVYNGSRDYIKKELKSFINNEFTLKDDNVDKSKPIHATIDMSSDNVEVTIINKE